MADLLGSGRSETIDGTSEADLIFAEGGADTVNAGAGDDRVHGGGGNDTLNGDDGDDALFGAANKGGAVDMSKFVIGEDVTGRITFLGETAGFKNALGMYKIADDGSIVDVEILFANASLKGSGGNLISGQSSVEVDLKAGDKIGFFVVPNGFAQQRMANLLADQAGSFKLVGADGAPANVNGGGEVKLVHVSAQGVETLVNSQYGSSIFHSFGGAESGLNGDGFNHVKADVDVAEGMVRIGFEDLWKGGDKDYDDSVFAFEIGQTNAALLPKEKTKEATSSDDDVMHGGKGDDMMFGMAGNDLMYGGKGNDRMWGNSGDDTMYGDQGNDQMAGGTGNDVMDGGGGHDVLAGNSGDDAIHGGAGNDAITGDSGNDKISDGQGNDRVSGGSGDDVLLAGAGNDYYDGGSGFDTLDFSYSRRGVTVDLNSHTVKGLGKDSVWGVEKVVGSSRNDSLKGDKNDNVLEGGAGNDGFRGLGGADTFTGGEGRDTYLWYAKDIIDASTGEHLGVDHITDFSAGDKLSFRELLKGQSYGSLDEVVSVTASEKGALVSVMIGGQFVEVVTLAGVEADDVLSSNMIFV